MTLTYGELCAGYGGLYRGIQSVLGGDLAWYSEFDPAPSKVMAHYHSDAPNIGDMTKIDWHTVEPVDVLAGGFPCQPVSIAGKRAGVSDERWLFDDIIRALRVLDPPPRLCVFENVLGLLSANGGHAMARVVEGLASVGYVGTYGVLAASDVGAPHQRKRVFIIAQPAAADLSGLEGLADQAGAARAGRHGHVERPDLTLLPTPRASDMNGAGVHGNGGMDLRTTVSLLPHKWGDYADAIARWEALTRPAPAPTEVSPKGKPRLSPRFVEWMMGLPEGHVTDPAIGLTRNQALKALGNGVVPQQAAAATLGFLADMPMGAVA